MGSGDRLGRRTLNRTLLDRQWLDRRRSATALQAIEHLVAIQAQEPLEPYPALWARLDPFAPADLVELLTTRRAVRTTMMRATLHLMSSADARSMRPLHRAMLLTRVPGGPVRQLAAEDLDALTEDAAACFRGQPLTSGDAARVLAARWPDVPFLDLKNALALLVPLVQVPPRGLWGRAAPARLVAMDWWLRSPPVVAPTTLDDVVLRYLRAFGPASSSDVRAWSGLAGLKPVLARLRPALRGYRDEAGRELLDVADGVIADADRPVPPRFLPAFDNAVLGYADRGRVIDDDHRGLSVAGTRFVLVDGRVAGAWTTADLDGGGVRVTVTPLRALSRTETHEVLGEAHRLAELLGSGVPGDARVT